MSMYARCHHVSEKPGLLLHYGALGGRGRGSHPANDRLHTPRGRGQRWVPAKAASLAPQGACDSSPSPGCSGGSLKTFSYIMRDLPLTMSPVRHAIVKQGPV